MKGGENMTVNDLLAEAVVVEALREEIAAMREMIDALMEGGA